MVMVDPTYLRFVCDELNSGKLDKSNPEALPAGISSFFDGIFQPGVSVVERKNLLDKFAIMALQRDGISLEHIARLTSSTAHDWKDFIQRYSRYFIVDSKGGYRLFHDRFHMFIHQRTSGHNLKMTVQGILGNFDLLDDEKWKIENKGYFLFLNGEIESLYAHILSYRDHQNQPWWIKDLERLLDALFTRGESMDIEYNPLCELLRVCFDFDVQRKGVRMIVLNARHVDWDGLDVFFHTSRFQYELAAEFARCPRFLPHDWERVFLDEDHPCSYTFSYVWKYMHFNLGNDIDRALLERVWVQGSPYLRIIVIMIWGYRRLNGLQEAWFDDLVAMEYDWQYLTREKGIWVSFFEDKSSSRYEQEFVGLNSIMEERFHYIFDNYWSLFAYCEKLNQDVRHIWRSDQALAIAFWMYRHPVWELGKIANEIVVNRLRAKDMRNETIEWLLFNWEKEEFYAVGEVIFELRQYLEEAEFLSLLRQMTCASSCHHRGQIISDLAVYLEGGQDEAFGTTIANDFLPHMVGNASDIWEVQELIRLLNYFMEKGILDGSRVRDYLSKMAIARDIEDPHDVEYNEFWKKAEINMGYAR